MLPFFRKIRFRLASENQLFKYARYAIGEIVLVVIGILIALQINTWNEDRKLEKERLDILQNLRSDFVNDLNNYRANIERLNKRQEVADEVLDLLENVPEVIDSVEVARKLLVIGFVEESNPSFATYNEIQSSGKLGLLKSVELKKSLANLKSSVTEFRSIGTNWDEDIKDYERLISGHISGNIPQQLLDTSIVVHVDNSNLRFDLQEIAQDPEIIGRIRHISYFTKMQVNIKHLIMVPTCEQIIEQIDSQLAR